MKLLFKNILFLVISVVVISLVQVGWIQLFIKSIVVFLLIFVGSSGLNDLFKTVLCKNKRKIALFMICSITYVFIDNYINLNILLSYGFTSVPSSIFPAILTTVLFLSLLQCKNILVYNIRLHYSIATIIFSLAINLAGTALSNYMLSTITIPEFDLADSVLGFMSSLTISTPSYTSIVSFLTKTIQLLQMYAVVIIVNHAKTIKNGINK